MARLPVPGQDNGTWGNLLNDFLTTEHNTDGSLKIRTDNTTAPLVNGKIPVANLGSGSASSSNYLRGDGTWAAPSATDANAVHKGDLIINVKDYGATGDGTTNDSAAIQSALNAAAASSTRNTVFFPAGMYRIGTRLTLPAGTVLRGVSSGTYPTNNSLNQVSVLARVAGMNDHILFAPADNNAIHILDLAIDGNKNNNTSGCGLYIEDHSTGVESQIIVERCYFHDNPDSNVYLGHYRRANKLVRSVFNYSANADGVTIAGSDNTIDNCILGTNARCGIAVGSTTTQWYSVSGGFGATLNHISNNDIYGNQIGIAISQYSSSTMVINNGIDRQDKSGLSIYDGTANLIIGNTFNSNGKLTHNTYPHIDVGTNVSAVTIANNNFSATGGGITNLANYAVYVPGTANKVHGNLGTYDAGSTAGGFVNVSANTAPWAVLSNVGAIIQGSGNEVLSLRNSSGTAMTRVTQGGSFIHSGGAVTLSGTSNNVIGSSTAIGTNANVLSVKTSGTGVANIATQNIAAQTAPNIVSYASDGTTPIFRVDQSGGVSALGVTGATAASRYAGGTASGAPVSGTFAIGDFVIDQTGKVWICTAAGTPGTWTAGASGATVDNATLPLENGKTAIAGNSTSAAPQNHVHPRTHWTPSDHGLVTWSMDVVAASANSVVTTAGTLYVARVHVPVAASATNLLAATTGTATLTSGQCFASLYNAAGTLIGSTADQATNWATAGVKTMALTGGPFALTAGDYYIGFYVNGSALPNFARGNNQIGGAFLNAGLSSGYRFATANTGLTTTPAATLGTLTASGFSWWLAIS